ncbi:hypothetical protein LTR66_014856 [Elasticomyces elasticus]|nr:hypothetical protein LTR66_014856 [Elasticomyces elasticus]
MIRQATDLAVHAHMSQMSWGASPNLLPIKLYISDLDVNNRYVAATYLVKTVQAVVATVAVVAVVAYLADPNGPLREHYSTRTAKHKSTTKPASTSNSSGWTPSQNSTTSRPAQKPAQKPLKLPTKVPKWKQSSTASWKPVKSTPFLSPTDLLRVGSGSFQHWAVCVGDEMYEFTARKTLMPEIQRYPFRLWLREKRVHNLRYDSRLIGYTRLSEDQINLAFMQFRDDVQKGEYDLLDNNCQTFAKAFTYAIRSDFDSKHIDVSLSQLWYEDELEKVKQFPGTLSGFCDTIGYRKLRQWRQAQFLQDPARGGGYDFKMIGPSTSGHTGVLPRNLPDDHYVNVLDRYSTRSADSGNRNTRAAGPSMRLLEYDYVEAANHNNNNNKQQIAKHYMASSNSFQARHVENKAKVNLSQRRNHVQTSCRPRRRDCSSGIEPKSRSKQGNTQDTYMAILDQLEAGVIEHEKGPPPAYRQWETFDYNYNYYYTAPILDDYEKTVAKPRCSQRKPTDCDRDRDRVRARPLENNVETWQIRQYMNVLDDLEAGL